jgi:hypothetical protein
MNLIMILQAVHNKIRLLILFGCLLCGLNGNSQKPTVYLILTKDSSVVERWSEIKAGPGSCLKVLNLLGVDDRDFDGRSGLTFNRCKPLIFPLQIRAKDLVWNKSIYTNAVRTELWKLFHRYRFIIVFMAKNTMTAYEVVHGAAMGRDD